MASKQLPVRAHAGCRDFAHCTPRTPPPLRHLRPADPLRRLLGPDGALRPGLGLAGAGAWALAHRTLVGGAGGSFWGPLRPGGLSRHGNLAKPRPGGTGALVGAGHPGPEAPRMDPPRGLVGQPARPARDRLAHAPALAGGGAGAGDDLPGRGPLARGFRPAVAARPR